MKRIPFWPSPFGGSSNLKAKLSWPPTNPKWHQPISRLRMNSQDPQSLLHRIHVNILYRFLQLSYMLYDIICVYIYIQMYVCIHIYICSLIGGCSDPQYTETWLPHVIILVHPSLAMLSLSDTKKVQCSSRGETTIVHHLSASSPEPSMDLFKEKSKF